MSDVTRPPGRPWDQHPVIAAVLERHFPTIVPAKKEIRCACGWSQHFVSATAWHRHAAAMVVNALGAAAE